MAQTPRTRERRAAFPEAEPTRPRRLFRPDTDIYETDDDVVLTVDMPGVDEDGFDVVLENRVLTIRGRSAFDEHPGYRRIYAEYEDGDYERSFALTEDVDQDRIEATQTNGVLTVRVPKTESAKVKRIAVRVS